MIQQDFIREATKKKKKNKAPKKKPKKIPKKVPQKNVAAKLEGVGGGGVRPYWPGHKRTLFGASQTPRLHSLLTQSLTS